MIDGVPRRGKKLYYLLEKNQMKQSRRKLIDKYREALNYDITVEHFVDAQLLSVIARMAYRKLQSEFYGQAISTAEGVFAKLERLKECSCAYMDRVVVFCYFDFPVNNKPVGGLKLLFRESWELMARINQPMTNVLVVEPSLQFGFCIEVKEYNYTVTSWGFG